MPAATQVQTLHDVFIDPSCDISSLKICRELVRKGRDFCMVPVRDEHVPILSKPKHLVPAKVRSTITF